MTDISTYMGCNEPTTIAFVAASLRTLDDMKPYQYACVHLHEDGSCMCAVIHNQEFDVELHTFMFDDGVMTRCQD